MFLDQTSGKILFANFSSVSTRNDDVTDRLRARWGLNYMNYVYATNALSSSFTNSSRLNRFIIINQLSTLNKTSRCQTCVHTSDLHTLSKKKTV